MVLQIRSLVRGHIRYEGTGTVAGWLLVLLLQLVLVGGLVRAADLIEIWTVCVAVVADRLLTLVTTLRVG